MVRMLRLQVAAGVVACLSWACGGLPPREVHDLHQTAQDYAARRLPTPVANWTRADWLRAALDLNPELVEARARAKAVAAGERTAAQRANPDLGLTAGYVAGSGPVAVAADATGWLYGLALDMLLPRPGERQRAIDAALLRSAAARADLVETLWKVRDALRQAQLDAVSSADRGTLLGQLVAARESLLRSTQARLRAGEVSGSEALDAERELAIARRRQAAARLQFDDALARLAAATGVPAAALQGVTPAWPSWDIAADIDAGRLQDDRVEALHARPDLLRALNECELAEIALQDQTAQRWPGWRVSPGVDWDSTSRQYRLGLSLPLPLFNHNEGPIGEALAARESAGLHLVATQAAAFSEMDRAQGGWQRARNAWVDTQATLALSQHSVAAGKRALAAGALDRQQLLLSEVAGIEARLDGLDAAYAAQTALASLEDAYRRPLEGPELKLPMSWRVEQGT